MEQGERSSLAGREGAWYSYSGWKYDSRVYSHYYFLLSTQCFFTLKRAQIYRVGFNKQIQMTNTIPEKKIKRCCCGDSAGGSSCYQPWQSAWDPQGGRRELILVSCFMLSTSTLRYTHMGACMCMCTHTHACTHVHTCLHSLTNTWAHNHEINLIISGNKTLKTEKQNRSKVIPIFKTLEESISFNLKTEIKLSIESLYLSMRLWIFFTDFIA